MKYKKFIADKLFTGIQMLDESNVLITDNDGRVVDIVNSKDAGDDVFRVNGILSPGFVNCHCHLELSHMRGLIPEKTGLINFVFCVVTQRHFAEEEIIDAIANAEIEMIKNGIVAVGDICNTNHTLTQKIKAQIPYYNFVETSGWLPTIAKSRFERSKNVYDQFRTITQHTSIVPHAPYSVSAELWHKISPYFNNKVASIHNQETAFEDEFFRKGTGDFVRMYQLMNIDNSHFSPTGKSSISTYLHQLGNAANVLLVHNTYTGVEDLHFAMHQADASNQQLFWCLCVNANLYIENKLPDINRLVQQNCRIVLGTDSLASNKSLSILDEMKTIKQHANGITNETLLKWATLNGAEALQMHETLGSFEKGKTPGVVVVAEDLSSVKKIF